MFKERKFILVIILLVAFSMTGYFFLIVIPSRLVQQSYEGARQIGRDISKAFNITPEVTVNNTVVLQQQTPILELATLSQKFQHQYDWTNTWLGSTKKINISGIFEAKAGFNLKQKFSIQITDDKAIVFLPKPELLSLALIGDVKSTDEHGVWNWVDTADRMKAMNAFIQDARKYGEQASFIEESKQEIERKLKEIFLLHGKEVEIRYSSQEKIRPL